MIGECLNHLKDMYLDIWLTVLKTDFLAEEHQYRVNPTLLLDQQSLDSQLMAELLAGFCIMSRNKSPHHVKNIIKTMADGLFNGTSICCLFFETLGKKIAEKPSQTSIKQIEDEGLFVPILVGLNNMLLTFRDRELGIHSYELIHLHTSKILGTIVCWNKIALDAKVVMPSLSEMVLKYGFDIVTAFTLFRPRLSQLFKEIPSFITLDSSSSSSSSSFSSSSSSRRAEKLLAQKSMKDDEEQEEGANGNGKEKGDETLKLVDVCAEIIDHCNLKFITPHLLMVFWTLDTKNLDSPSNETLKWIASFKQQLFSKDHRHYDSLFSLYQICILPRLQLSKEDASFCVKFFELLHSQNTPFFSTIRFSYIVEMCLRNSVATLTIEAAPNFSHFINTFYTLLKSWNSPSDFQKKCVGSPPLCGFLRDWDDDKLFDFKRFSNGVSSFVEKCTMVCLFSLFLDLS